MKNRVIAFLGLILFLYLFISSIVLIKNSFAEIGKEILKFTRDNTSPVNAFGFGWLLTLVMQSSGAATSALAILNISGLIGTSLMIFMILGTRIGTTITALFVALLVHAKRRDFRHGFEIGLANLVYAFPIALIMFFIEYFFGFFSREGNYFVTLGFNPGFNLVDIVTKPLTSLISFLPNFVLAFLGIALLIISLREMPKQMFNLFGEDFLRNRINKYLGKKWQAFLIGFLITAVFLSTSITITLLIPVIISRLVNLKRAIPYIIGANLGGVLDIILFGLVIGKTAIPAVFAYVSFSIIGVLWLFNTNLLFDITKFISKRTLHVSKRRAFLFVLFFVLLALILALI